MAQIGSARSSYLRMLDPVQNHALRLCLGAFRTSPSSSLCILANEPPLHLCRQKLSMQYCLRLSSTSQNPAYSAIFKSKFISSFERKPNQIPLLEFEFTLTCRLSASEEKILYIVLPCQHRLGSSTVLKSTSVCTQFIKMTLHRGIADGQVGPVLTGPLFGQTEFFFSCQRIFHPWNPCTSISAI